jgi:CubicO group peptidase (beta-lactamase class C family)
VTRPAATGATGFMTGAPPFGADRLVTLEHWQDPPGNRWAFQHVRELIPSARIARGNGPTWELRPEHRDVLDLRLGIDGSGPSVEQLLDRTQTDGFLVLHRGRIVAEHYFNGMTPETPHLLMSVSKSITAAVAGCLAGRGLLEVDAPVTDFLPELAGTSFKGATVQQLLDMRTGTRFDENYANLEADVRVYEQVYLWRPRTDPSGPADAISYFATLHNDGEHGGPFRYRSILTDVLAWVLERVGGARFHELVSRELWAPIGAEFDAEVTLDSHGNSMADGGISTTLRDLGRFGLQYLTSATTDRPHVVPRTWVLDTIRGAADGPEAFRAHDDQPGFPLGAHYRNCWWVRDPVAPYLHGSGIYGQNVFVHEATETVVVKFSTWPTPLDRPALEVMAAAVIVIGEHLEDQGASNGATEGSDGSD